ncbi:uncharacterized protein LOC107809593 [Nicotiana tabacum]|uniref:Uncharacterized protein LOC107809593 n=1 Tax=Nicotiana tabacum TaxID=4097 RepID=A0A1S4BLM5_TOBAC
MDVIPCEHALAIVTKYDMDEYQYCSGYCTKDYMLKTYEVPVYPIPDESQWEISGDVLGDAVKPQKVRVKPGRPKKIRLKGAGEFQGKRCKITCSLCGQQGHNKKSCRNPPKNV